jgi:hypothetical protein
MKKGKFGFDSHDDDEEYEYAGGIIAETDKAWLLNVSGEETWFPKSKCEINEGAGTITVPQWLAEQKGLV